MTPTLRIARRLAAAVVLVAAFGTSSAVRANHYILCPEEKCAEAGWSLTGSLNSARSNHSATLLRDGKVLVAGGLDDNGVALATAELYDPATGTWALTAPMTQARAGHFAFLLPTGAVLVIGGDQPCCLSNVTAEVYDPANGLWSPAGSLDSPFGMLSATMLPSGNIFLSGVAEAYRTTASWLYDAPQKIWIRASGDPIYRQEPSMSVLPDGTVLVTGGSRDADEFLVSRGAEVYDPTTDTWGPTSSPGTPRLAGTTTLLADGSLLVAGGFTPTGIIPGPTVTGQATLLRTSEVYGVDRAWHPVGELDEARVDHTATLLPNGHVLIAGGLVPQSGAGGSSTWATLASAEVYDPLAANWTNADSLIVARMGHTATLLDDGSVLVVGGVGGDSSTGAAVLRSAEIYHP